MTRQDSVRMRSTSAAVLLVFIIILGQFSVSMVTALELEQLDSCRALVNGQVINLRSLGNALHHGLTAEFGEGDIRWNYTYRPCYSFNMPEDPSQGFGDKCLSVSVCKYATHYRRQYYYTLGFERQTKFLVDQPSNISTAVDVKIVFEGYKSMKGKKTYIKLVCDRSRQKPEDALFKIVGDDLRLGDVNAELHHVCSCLNGCPLVTSEILIVPNISSNTSYNTTDGAFVSRTSGKMKADRMKVLIVVGVNIGIFLLAGFVGLTCYNKRAVRSDFYSKVPGVKSTPEPTWQMTEAMMENEKPTVPLALSMAGSIKEPVLPERAVSARDKFRDGAPQIQRRKSFCFPVLEHGVIPEECIKLGQRLGGGMFGDTYIGQWTGVTVAVKRVTLSVHKYQLDNAHVLHMQDQVGFLSTQRHRNIVSVLGFCSESKHPYIISEFVNGQVVKDYIRTPNVHITWPDRVKMLSQIADGMAFLHSTSPPILHRDLRCANLFITSNDVIKVCDFGIVNITQPLRSSCKVDDCCCQGLFSACPPSIAWTAPEVLQYPNSTEEDGYITMASDVYSFGIVTWELLMCDDPYSDMKDMNTAQEVMTYVKNGGRPQIPSQMVVLEPYKELMHLCWQAVPEERYSFKKVTAYLKELLYQAKHFQKMLSSRQSRSRQRSSHSTSSISRIASSIEKSLGRAVRDVSPASSNSVSFLDDVSATSSS